MLTVTEEASKKLKDALDNTETQPGQTFRLVEEQESMRLTLDTEQEGDQVVEYGGETVLLLDEDLQTKLENLTLDLQDSPQGQLFAFVPKKPE